MRHSLVSRGWSAASLLLLVGACSGSGQETCTTRADCSPGQQCTDGTCVTPPALRACVTDDECDAADQCGPDQVCVPRESGSEACAASSECGEAEQCDVQTMTCVPLPDGACKRPEQCPEAAPQCSAPANGVGRCLQCLQPADCPVPGSTCTVQGTCVAPLPSSSSSAGASSTSSGPAPSSSAAASSSSSAGASSSSHGTASSGSGAGVDLGGWVLGELDSTTWFEIPAGTRVPPGGVLVVARGVDRADFQAVWNVQLGANVVFLNAAGFGEGLPWIQGGEQWVLENVDLEVQDGPSITGEYGMTHERSSSAAARDALHWSVHSSETATPGVSLLGSQDHGLFISEWSDAPGSGRYNDEFVEIFVNP